MHSAVIYIMGVAGSGKTTIGKGLSEKTGIPFFDADDFHPPANVEKMRAGVALTDDDREGWLEALHQLAMEQMNHKGAIIACSALKEKYRKILSARITVPLHWVFLQGNYELILARMQARKEHYMPPALLQSQFEILEPPADAIVLDISKPPEILLAILISQIERSR